jgi:hypothetical protein
VLDHVHEQELLLAELVDRRDERDENEEEARAEAPDAPRGDRRARRAQRPDPPRLEQANEQRGDDLQRLEVPTGQERRRFHRSQV